MFKRCSDLEDHQGGNLRKKFRNFPICFSTILNNKYRPVDALLDIAKQVTLVRPTTQLALMHNAK
jgi:hypothetical protein